MHPFITCHFLYFILSKGLAFHNDITSTRRTGEESSNTDKYVSALKESTPGLKGRKGVKCDEPEAIADTHHCPTFCSRQKQLPR
jgi:hypothetical protein